MGNDKLGKKEITQLFKEGWKLRIKKVNDRRYMTIRKGDRERGLGSFDQEKFNEILSLKNDLRSIKTGTNLQEAITQKNESSLSESIKRQKLLIEELRKQLDELQLYRGIIKSAECAHIRDRYCTVWNWEKKEQIPKSHRFNNLLWEPEFKEIIIPGTNEHRWAARAAPPFCKYCAMYKQRE